MQVEPPRLVFVTAIKVYQLVRIGVQIVQLTGAVLVQVEFPAVGRNNGAQRLGMMCSGRRG